MSDALDAAKLAQHPKVEGAIDRLADRILSDGPLSIPRVAVADFISEVLTVYRESLATEDVMSAAIVAGLRAVGMSPVVVTHGDRLQMEAAAPILLGPSLARIAELEAELAKR